MLQLMRKHAKNWLIKLILGLVALVFVFWGVGSYGPDRDERAAEVNGLTITMAQVMKEYSHLSEAARKRFGPQYEQLAGLLNLKQRALNELVDQALLTQAAERIGITVSNSEVIQSIRSQRIFQRNGVFDQRLYQHLLSNNHLTPEAFEQSTRLQLSMTKLSALLAGTVQTTPLEIQQQISLALSRVKGVYLIFDPADYLDQQKASDLELRAYHEKHRRQYLVPEQVKLTYLVFPAADYQDKVHITDDDIADTYEIERSRYVNKEQVKARHILIKVPKDALPKVVEAAQKQAQEILEQAQKPGADFAGLAKRHSQGPTAAKGGELGWISRGDMVPGFERTAFALKPGQVGLARSQYGFHVVQVQERKAASITPLDQVAGEIRSRLEDLGAHQMAQAAAERAFDQAAGGASLAQVAGKLNQGLEQTDWVAEGAAVPGLSEAKGLWEALRDLAPGVAAPPVAYKDGAALVAVAERKPEFVRPLKDVRVEVEQAVLQEKAQQAARAAAAAMLAQVAKDPDPAKALAGQKGAKTTGWFRQDQQIKGLKRSEELAAALFLRPQGAPVLREPVPAGDGYAAAVLAGREHPSAQVVEEKRPEFRDRLLTAKRSGVLQDFLADLRAAADIKVLAKLN